MRKADEAARLLDAAVAGAVRLCMCRWHLWCCSTPNKHTSSWRCVVACFWRITCLAYHFAFVQVLLCFCCDSLTEAVAMLRLGSMLCSLSGCTRARRRCAAAAAGADGQREPSGARGTAAARGGRGGRARAPAHGRHCPRAGHGAAAVDAGAHPSGGPLLLHMHVVVAATTWPLPLLWAGGLALLTGAGCRPRSEALGCGCTS